MSEATRLEHAIDNTHTESFDLTRLLQAAYKVIRWFTLIKNLK